MWNQPRSKKAVQKRVRPFVNESARETIEVRGRAPLAKQHNVNMAGGLYGARVAYRIGDFMAVEVPRELLETFLRLKTKNRTLGQKHFL